MKSNKLNFNTTKIIKIVTIVTIIIWIGFTISSSDAITNNNNLNSIYSVRTQNKVTEIHRGDTIDGADSAIIELQNQVKSSWQTFSMWGLFNYSSKNQLESGVNSESIDFGGIATSSEYVYQNNNENVDVLYISEYDTNRIISCDITALKLVNCSTALTGLAGPQNIIIINKKIYIINRLIATITACDLQHNGKIISCKNTSLPIKDPVRIIYDSGGVFYISDFGVKSIISCELNNNGSITRCAKAVGIHPNLLEYTTFGGYGYSNGYSANAINKCSMNYNESLSCSQIKDPAIKNPLTIRILNNHAYIINMTESKTQATHITSCAILPNGDFTGCMNIANNFKLALGLAIYTRSN